MTVMRMVRLVIILGYLYRLVSNDFMLDLPYDALKGYLAGFPSEFPTKDKLGQLSIYYMHA